MSETSTKKFQWSYFLDPHRNEQIVIRTDDEAEFELLRAKFKAQSQPVDNDPAWVKEASQPMITPNAYPATPQRTFTPHPRRGPGKCEKCGADMVQNPHKGTWFCKEKCWLKNAPRQS